MVMACMEWVLTVIFKVILVVVIMALMDNMMRIITEFLVLASGVYGQSAIVLLVTVFMGTMARVSAFTAKVVSGGQFANNNDSVSVRLATATAAIDATGAIMNQGLTIAANGDISSPTGSVSVNDPQGMVITATDGQKGLIVNNTNGGITVNADNGGMTINSSSGGLTINSSTGGLKLQSHSTSANGMEARDSANNQTMYLNAQDGTAYFKGKVKAAGFGSYNLRKGPGQSIIANGGYGTDYAACNSGELLVSCGYSSASSLMYVYSVDIDMSNKRCAISARNTGSIFLLYHNCSSALLKSDNVKLRLLHFYSFTGIFFTGLDRRFC
jgi:hypothetical protein